MMKFKIQKTLSSDKDIIYPVRKGITNLDDILKFTGGQAPDFEGDLGKSHTLYSKEGSRIYLIGIGDSDDRSRLSDAFHRLAFKKGDHWSEDIQLVTKNLDERDVENAIIGLQLAEYQIGAYKSDDKKRKGTTVRIVTKKDLKEIVKRGQNIGESTNRIKSLVDAPPNIKTPEYLANWSKQSAKKYGYECEVKDYKTLQKEGFGAIVAVGGGSANKPRLIVTKYTSNKSGKIDIALVGKGITFDSGGISIKGATNLHYMKSDMGGAAAVMGAVELVAKMKLNLNVIGIVATAENAVDADSLRPGDVIKSYSGKTIEIIDTDAEGRLVLADALSYVIKEYEPKRVIDLATLTGSVVRTLEYSAAGMFSNDKDMSDALSQVGDHIRERVWPLPLYKDFEKDLHSDIADIRNFSGKPTGGAITAAKFLEAFTAKHAHWMHLDIAGVAFGSSDYAKMKSASGFGVRLLFEYMKTLKA